MNEEILHGLRWVLVADEARWQQELDRLLAPHAGDRAILREIESLLKERLTGADELYRPRMQSMVRRVGEQAKQAVNTSEDEFAPLAARWATLETTALALQADLARTRAEQAGVAARIRDLLGEGGARSAGALRFEVPPVRHTVHIVAPQKVPYELCRPRPDPDRVLRAWRQSGQAPDGTMITEERGDLLVLHEVTGGTPPEG